jgi:hypothetical protein
MDDAIFPYLTIEEDGTRKACVSCCCCNKAVNAMNEVASAEAPRLRPMIGDDVLICCLYPWVLID